MSTAETLVVQFGRMVAGDGGAVSLLEDGPDLIRIGYRMGRAPACDGDVCVMPHLELQDLMNETLQRREPLRRLVVERLK